MIDASGSTAYKYDSRGRQTEEKRTIDSVNYTTSYGYDGADRVYQITYPTGEVVTNNYNYRGLPGTLSGTQAGSLVTSALYNQLGSLTEINLYNTSGSTKTTYGYYGTGGAYDTTGGYYDRLWKIKTGTLQEMTYTWDPAGNLGQRQNLVSPTETETFTYDYLDRLTGSSGNYSESYTYNALGNLMSKNGAAYTYGSSRPHAVTQVGNNGYTYDPNGNMLSGNSRSYAWDYENRLVWADTSPAASWSDNFTSLNSSNWVFSGQQTLDNGALKNTGTGNDWAVNFCRSSYNINGSATG
jgi:YD repeat-containing protein